MLNKQSELLLSEVYTKIALQIGFFFFTSTMFQLLIQLSMYRDLQVYCSFFPLKIILRFLLLLFALWLNAGVDVQRLLFAATLPSGAEKEEGLFRVLSGLSTEGRLKYKQCVAPRLSSSKTLTDSRLEQRFVLFNTPMFNWFIERELIISLTFSKRREWLIDWLIYYLIDQTFP